MDPGQLALSQTHLLNLKPKIIVITIDGTIGYGVT